MRISAIGPLSIRPLVPKAIARLARRQPELTLTYDGKTRIEIEEWVAQGRANLGFTLLPASHPGLSAKEIATVSALAVVPATHPLAGRSSLGPADLVGQSVIIPHTMARVRTLVEANYMSAGLNLIPRIETANAISAVYLVSQRAGISVLDPFSGMSAPKDQVRLIRWDPDTPMTYGMIYQSNRGLTDIEDAFFADVAQNVGDYLRRHEVQ